VARVKGNVAEKQLVAGVDKRHEARIVGEIELGDGFLNPRPIGVVLVVDEDDSLRNRELHRDAHVVDRAFGQMAAIDAEHAEAAPRAPQYRLDMSGAHRHAVGALDFDLPRRYAAFDKIAL